MLDQQALQAWGVLLDQDMVCEVNGTRTVRKIPREAIETLVFQRSSSVRHPVLLGLFGLVLIALGLYPGLHIVDWLVHGGLPHEIDILLAIWLPVGMAALGQAVWPVPVLLVRGTSVTWKIPLRKPFPDADQLRGFMELAETRFGYRMTTRL